MKKQVQFGGGCSDAVLCVKPGQPPFVFIAEQQFRDLRGKFSEFARKEISLCTQCAEGKATMKWFYSSKSGLSGAGTLSLPAGWTCLPVPSWWPGREAGGPLVWLAIPGRKAEIAMRDGGHLQVLLFRHPTTGAVVAGYHDQIENAVYSLDHVKSRRFVDGWGHEFHLPVSTPALGKNEKLIMSPPWFVKPAQPGRDPRSLAHWLGLVPLEDGTLAVTDTTRCIAVVKPDHAADLPNGWNCQAGNYPGWWRYVGRDANQLVRILMFSPDPGQPGTVLATGTEFEHECSLDEACTDLAAQFAQAHDGLNRKLAEIRADAAAHRPFAEVVAELAASGAVIVIADATAAGCCKPGIADFREKFGIPESATVIQLQALPGWNEFSQNADFQRTLARKATSL
jgi:hypothetical protein